MARRGTRRNKMAIGGKIPQGVVGCFECSQFSNSITDCTNATQTHGCDYDAFSPGGSTCWCNSDYIDSNGISDRMCCNPEPYTPGRVRRGDTPGRVRGGSKNRRFAGRTQRSFKGKPYKR